MAKEELVMRKNLQVSALYANSNYDGEEGSKARKTSIDALEEALKQSIHIIYGGEITEEVDPEDPFMQAGRRALDKLDLPPVSEDRQDDFLKNFIADNDQS